MGILGNFNFLSGLGSGGGNPLAASGALGSFYDPEEMRRWQLRQAMMGAGIGLLSQGPSKTPIGFGDTFAAGMKGGLLGAQQAEQDYTQQALLASEYASKRAKEEREAAEKAEQDTAFDEWLGGLSPEDQLAARAMPDKAFEIYKANNPEMASNEYGLNPVITQNPETGEYMLLQPSKGGGAPRPMELPEGYQYVPPTRTLDVGTGYTTIPSRGTGTVGQPIPKNIAEQQAQEEIGTAAGKAAAAAPADVAAADMALGLLDSIETDPNLEWGVGFSSAGNFIPGTPGRDFQTKVDQATSGAFLSAIQQMRGLGALSNAEGQTATQAVTRMTTSTSEAAFKSALADYRRIVELGRNRAAARISGGMPAPGTPAGAVPQQGALEDPLGLRGP